MTISQVSKLTNTSNYTLRYYEDIGLITNVDRDDNNLRNYNEDNIKLIEFISCMRRAGMSINSLKIYMDYYNMDSDTNLERKNILIEERKKLLLKQKELKEAINLMNYKIDNYNKLLKK